MSRNSSPWLHPASRPLSDATSDDGERSEVRTRPPSRAPLTLRPPSGIQSGRGLRIDEKIRIAQALLEGLPEGDSRARLLRVAILRRDEVLLDGLIGELQRHTPEAPTRRRLSSHPGMKKKG